MAVLEGLTSLSAGVALPGCSLHSHSQNLMNLASNLSWWLLSCIFIWRDFICTKTCEQSVSRLHAWVHPGNRVWSWTTLCEAAAQGPCAPITQWASTVCPHPRWVTLLGWEALNPSPEHSVWKPSTRGKKIKNKKTDLEMGLMNHPGVVGSFCWQHWLWMSFLWYYWPTSVYKGQGFSSS